MLRHDHRVTLAALAGGAPGVAAAWWLAARFGGEAGGYALAATATGAWLVGAAAVRTRVERPLQTLANMLAALREGDFSTRGRAARPDDALGLAFVEANLLTATLREERLRALESAALLRRVLAEIDAAIFAFDEQGRLRLVNRAGERLLARSAERALGETAAALGLSGLGLGDFVTARDQAGDDGAPAMPGPRVVPATFPGGGGRWEVRAGVFRQGGRPHRLLVVTDLSETLRAEERQAWQRLVRVLSHEINNSLAPIKTIAGSLRRRVQRAVAPSALPAPGATGGGDVRGDDVRGGDVREADGTAALERGLATIAERADALARFVGAYARLSRLPPPALRPVDVGAWIGRVAALEPRVPVAVRGGPATSVEADPDQLEQLLINLVRNAADATLDAGGDGGTGAVTVAWVAEAGRVRVTVDDDGTGLASSANLFVPFYSTKPEGNGIGLALARQIAEAHGGTVTLANRDDGHRGCRAVVTLPLRPPARPRAA